MRGFDLVKSGNAARRIHRHKPDFRNGSETLTYRDCFFGGEIAVECYDTRPAPATARPVPGPGYSKLNLAGIIPRKARARAASTLRGL